VNPEQNQELQHQESVVGNLFCNFLQCNKSLQHVSLIVNNPSDNKPTIHCNKLCDLFINAMACNASVQHIELNMYQNLREILDHATVLQKLNLR
jgi:hypothetical protein